MAVKKFRFVSPGVFVNEIDNSQLPASPAGIGPVVIGRSPSGPGLRPVTVSSFSEFVDVFGSPVPGGAGSDVWRDGNTVGPTYGMYAAQAYLRNSAPLTFVRLMGAQSATKASSGGPGNLGGTTGWRVNAANASSGEGAYGLFIFDSASSDNMVKPSGHSMRLYTTGALAAIFYADSSPADANSSSFALSGALAATSSQQNVCAPCIMVEGDANYEFKMAIANAKGTQTITSSFNFNRESPRYIRKVFNTNPQLSNAQTTETPYKYWLGETFDRHLKNTITAADVTYGAIIPLVNASDTSSQAGDFRMPLQNAQSPWIFAQDVSTDYSSFNPNNMQKLFKFHALNEPGEWTSRNLKISIEDVKASTNDYNGFGSFTVIVRKLDDSDNVVQVLEQFDNCSLNPDSLNYVARVVGDRYTTWDESNRRYREYGQYDNRSRYIRIQMNTDVDNGNLAYKEYLPFGFQGMVKYADQLVSGAFMIAGESSLLPEPSYDTMLAQSSSAYMPPGSLMGQASLMLSGTWCASSSYVGAGFPELTASIKFPAPVYRTSGSDGGLGNYTDAYFGFQVSRTAGSTRFDESYLDMLRPLGGITTDQHNASATGCELGTAFTLDDLQYVGSGSLKNAAWVSGSRASNLSLTALSSSWKQVLSDGFDRFTVPLNAGFDGFNIREPEPFNNTDLDDSTTEFNYYANYSVKRAIDSISDPEQVDMNIATIPGVWHEGTTNHLINTCEDRADALAIVDLKGDYKAHTENTESFSDRVGSVSTTVDNLNSRGLNTSYACAYYPWVQIRDTINGNLIWVPPSVAALGTLSSSQRKSQVWFAPAGFNRGGLTEGAAGLPVVNVVEQLNRKERDDLYEANINPIAKFPAEGIVIFGQKTLQVTPSALDRINVRRLLIFVKKRISQMANQLLFEPNVQQTWDRFVGMVNPFLDQVKTNFGLSDYLMVLDETTTTPDLVDRNILYAKIFLKPTRAIEFIALDFNITRTGASFVD